MLAHPDLTMDRERVQRYPFVVVYNDAKWNLEKRFSDFAELDAALDEAQKNGDFGDAQVTSFH